MKNFKKSAGEIFLSGLRGVYIETQNPEIPKKHRVHTNFFGMFARTFAYFPVTRVRNPTENCSEKLVEMNLFIWGGFWGVNFPPVIIVLCSRFGSLFGSFSAFFKPFFRVKIKAFRGQLRSADAQP